MSPTTTTRAARPSDASLDARAIDALPYPSVSYATARMFAGLSPASLGELRARLGRSMVLLTDTLDTIGDADVSAAVDAHGEMWELLRDVETVEAIRCAVLVSEAW